ncbi:carbamoyl transferase [Myxococcota bacterium]|nr:carbamoyl transferase [Myxococcota bacterium]
MTASAPRDIILGVFDGTHDAGAAVVADGRVIAACNEERWTRVKGQGGWPARSIAACLSSAGLAPQDLGAVAFAGLINPNPGLRVARGVQRRWRLDAQWYYRPSPTAGSRLGDWLQFDSPFPHLRSDGAVARALAPLLARRLRAQLREALGSAAAHLPLRLLDHHRCHAASAWHTAGWDEGLVVVADGLGDGLATTIWRGRGPTLELLDARPYPDSYGLLYATITGFLGFRPFRHEGKLTGLAAHGDASAVDVAFPFEGPPDARRFTLRHGMSLRPWLEQLRPYSREDLSAWLQHHLERDLSGLVGSWARRQGLRRVALAGGVFANVRLNQVLSALPEVDHLWVFPHMGDGGLAIGAALLAWAEARPEAWQPRPLPDAFLGPSWDETALRRAVDAAGLRLRPAPDLSAEVADRLARGEVLARFDGAMEVGPRALGHRSILAPTALPIPERLNQALRRSDFMPFAPVLLAEDADDWTLGLDPVRHSAAFMTVAVQARPALAQACPAVVHVDGSLRPQLVGPGDASGLHSILRAYRARTGLPALLNTSFNMHEEPIVCGPDDAIGTFLAAGLDALAIGPFLATR